MLLSDGFSSYASAFVGVPHSSFFTPPPPGVVTNGPPILLCFKLIPASFISLPNQISSLVVGDASLIPAHEHQQRRKRPAIARLCLIALYLL